MATVADIKKQTSTTSAPNAPNVQPKNLDKEVQQFRHVFEIDLDANEHMTDQFERDHFGSFVMPFDTELDPDEFARDPQYDLFIGQPRFFNGSYP